MFNIDFNEARRTLEDNDDDFEKAFNVLLLKYKRPQLGILYDDGQGSYPAYTIN